MVRDGTSHNHERAVHCTQSARRAHDDTHDLTRHPAKLPYRVASKRQGHVANVKSQISGSICLILRPRAQTHTTQRTFFVSRCCITELFTEQPARRRRGRTPPPKRRVISSSGGCGLAGGSRRDHRASSSSCARRGARGLSGHNPLKPHILRYKIKKYCASV